MKKFAIFVILFSLCATPSYAQIMDIPEKVLMTINKVNEKLVVVEKSYQEYRKLKTQIKSGIMGSATVKMFKEIQKVYNTGKALKEKYAGGNVNVFYAFYDVLSAAEVLNNSIEYIGVMYQQVEISEKRKGATSDVIAELESEDEQRIKDVVSTLYARGLATRYKNQKYADEYLEPDVDFEEEMSILQAIRPVLERTMERKANVLFMEAAILEYHAFRALGALPAELSTDLGGNSGEITSSNGLVVGGEE